MIESTEKANHGVESSVRVRYKETDQMGIAHHANYLVWFEIGRTDLCREVGLSYRGIEEQGLMLVVNEIRCRYMRPFRYDDEVRIRTRIGAMGSRGIRFEYELVDEAEMVRATGYSSHIWVDRETRKTVVPPEGIASRFRALVQPR